MSSTINRINLGKVKGVPLSTNFGNTDNGTIRLVLSDDSQVGISVNDNTVKLDVNQGAGAVGTKTLRTITATDSPEVVSIGDSSDITIPATVSATASLKGLIRFLANLINPTISTIGGFAIADLVLSGTRTRTLQVSNNTSSLIWMQIHNKATSLSAGDAPLNGYSVRVPANSTLLMGAEYFGFSGTKLATNPRVGLSSTFSTYTAILPANTSISAQVV